MSHGFQLWPAESHPTGFSQARNSEKKAVEVLHAYLQTDDFNYLYYFSLKNFEIIDMYCS